MSEKELDSLKQRVALLEQELTVVHVAKSALEQQLMLTSAETAKILDLLEASQATLKQEQKQAGNAAAFVDLAFNSMDSLLIVLDPKGRITRINEATTKELGYKTQELQGKNVDFLFCHYDLAEHGYAGKSIFDLIKEKIHFAGQHVLQTKSQQKLTYVVKASLLYDRYGKTSGGILSAINITPLLNHQSELQKSETVLDLLMKTANDALIVIDETDKVVVWNTKAEELFGYTADEVIGRLMHDLIVSKEDRDGFYRGLKHFRKSGLGPAINNTREVNAYRKDGSTFVSEVSISSGRIDGRWHAFGVVRDITERKAAENALVAAKIEADKASVAKSQFLATMSHEIRTPINGIIGMLHLCQQTVLDEQQRDYLNKTEFSAKNLLTIINDILDFSKVEAGKIELETMPFSLQSIKDSVLSSLDVKAREKGLDFDFIIDPAVPLDLIGDPARLNQVLLNLVANAIKFTAQGSVEVSVKLANRDYHQCCLDFSVSDTGIGIDKLTLPTLFESFKQADSSTTRKFGGTGLGLAISQKLTELMGGKIIAKSTLDKGSCFMFSLTFEVNNSCIVDHMSPGLFSRRLKVVLLEDNEVSMQCISEALSKMGAEVTGVNEPQQALKIIEQNPPDLILSDWMMPGMDGIGFFQELEKLGDFPQTLKVLMSAYDTSSEIANLKELSIDGVVKKPIDLRRLQTIVEEGQGTMQPDEDDVTGKKVLVAEDNLINAQVVKAILNSYGVEVESAENGEEAVEMVKNNQYDLILMDIQMPVMDGIEATKIIRQQLNVDTPIAALTANVLEEDIMIYLQAGANEHIAKPIDPQKLKMTVSRLIKN